MCLVKRSFDLKVVAPVRLDKGMFVARVEYLLPTLFVGKKLTYLGL